MQKIEIVGFRNPQKDLLLFFNPWYLPGKRPRNVKIDKINLGKILRAVSKDKTDVTGLFSAQTNPGNAVCAAKSNGWAGIFEFPPQLSFSGQKPKKRKIDILGHFATISDKRGLHRRQISSRGWISPFRDVYGPGMHIFQVSAPSFFFKNDFWSLAVSL